MKRTTLLNRHLSQLVAALGHMDEITICDAGLPMPRDAQIIDLAVSPGIPDFWSVIAALRSELVIEGYVVANEISSALENKMQAEMSVWATDQNRPINAPEKLDHTLFKQRTSQSKAIIRTGEITPYCNMILISGVAF